VSRRGGESSSANGKKQARARQSTNNFIGMQDQRSAFMGPDGAPASSTLVHLRLPSHARNITHQIRGAGNTQSGRSAEISKEKRVEQGGATAPSSSSPPPAGLRDPSHPPFCSCIAFAGLVKWHKYLDENECSPVIRDRLQHPSNASSAQDSAPKLARSTTVNINQVLQDQRRLECIQAHNTACNTCLKPHRT
jgi:hypothetical protein